MTRRGPDTTRPATRRRARAEAEDEAPSEAEAKPRMRTRSRRGAEAEDEEPEGEAAEAPAAPKRRRRPRGAGPPSRRPRRPRSPRRAGAGRGAIPTCRRRSCARRPSTCARRPARRGWCATTSAASRSRRRELSSLFTPRAIARDWSKLLESAVANAEHNHELVGEDLYVKAVHADEGPTIKRFRPRAMGRATRIRKRTSHLTILLTPKD